MNGDVVVQLVTSAQLAIGIVFAVSVSSKLRRPVAFARAVADYRVLPRSLSYLVAAPLVLFELVASGGLLIGWQTGPLVAGVTAALALFLFAVGVNLRRGRAIACGCFGASSEPISPRTVARLVLLLALALVVLVLRIAGHAGDAGLASLRVQPIEYILASWLTAAGMLLLGAWALRAPELWSIAGALRQPPTEAANRQEVTP